MGLAKKGDSKSKASRKVCVLGCYFSNINLISGTNIQNYLLDRHQSSKIIYFLSNGQERPRLKAYRY